MATKLLAAPQIRDRVLSLLGEHPEGLHVNEMIESIFGTIKDEDLYRRGAQRLSFALVTLRKAKHVQKGEGNLGIYKLHNGRPEPEVHDLAPRRGRKPSANGAAYGASQSLRSYIIRDIRAKLAELEALES